MVGLERAGFRGYRAKAISAVSKQSSGCDGDVEYSPEFLSRNTTLMEFGMGL